jgi:hypothetical protein
MKRYMMLIPSTKSTDKSIDVRTAMQYSGYGDVAILWRSDGLKLGGLSFRLNERLQ